MKFNSPKLNVSFEQLLDDSPIEQQAPNIDNIPDKSEVVDEVKDVEKAPVDDTDKSVQTPEKQEGSEEKSNETEKKPEGEIEENEDGSDSVIGLFKSSLGYEVDGEFEESFEGVLEYTRKAIPVAAQQVLTEVFDKFPEAEQLIRHLNEGHSIKTFVEQFNQPDILQVELNENTDPVVLERLMRDSLSQKGLDDDDVDMHVNFAKDTGKLLEKATKAHNELKQGHEQKVAQQKQAEKAELERIKREQDEAWNSVSNIVKSGKIANTIIPDAEKAKFLEFLSKPVKNGKTARDMKIDEMGIEDHLYLDYLVYKDAMKGSKGADSGRRNSLFEEMMNKRQKGRMKSEDNNDFRKNTEIKKPKDALKGMTFSQMLDNQ
jgi:hypothetical protein